MLEVILAIAAIVVGVTTAVATVALAFITRRYAKLTKDILETHNEPRIKIKIEPHKFAHLPRTTTEFVDTWKAGKLMANLYTISIENIGTGAAKEIKITKDPFSDVRFKEMLQGSKMFPKERYELIVSKAVIEKSAVNGFVEYEISYKSPTDKEIKDSFAIPITTINLIPSQESDIDLMSKGILAITKKYTGRDIKQEHENGSKTLEKMIDSNQD